ncbi:receptor-type tyrosine-protein phosphatase beta isoform X2 [Frieseomelitta varia]|uniref:receptor-type tyrosine-protein phosphatase beta isoform X2 n=1 Tax=Frieseomelitta varia TaxID=561572 RepID=UPI001CB6AB9B|nr:receptor-type tyrosine-protein phosphatase beta isoform X2 [Frieseomelitta varia]
MIQKIRLKVFIYTLQIIYVLGENNLIDIGQNKMANVSMKILSFNCIEYAVSSKINNLKSSVNMEEFPNETMKFDQNELLQNDYLEDNNIDASIFDVTINDFVQKFERISSIELKNNEILSKNISITCNEEDRKNVQNLTINLISTEWIFLSWEPPCNNTTNETLRYTIDICSLSNQQCFPNKIVEKDTQYNITNLEPCSNYKFIVKITNLNSTGVTVTGTTSYNITKIGDIRELVAHTTTNKIMLSWKPPENFSACINNYLVTQCLEDICNNILVAHENYTSLNLKSCEEYFFMIRVVSYFVQSSGVDITLKTNSPKSSQPQNPTVEANAFSVFIHWQTPEIGAKCIKYYRVTIDPQTTTKQVTGTNITISDLYACTSYSIYINAVDEDNNDGEMAIMQTKTGAAISKPPILHMEETIVTNNNITFSWKIEKGNNNCTLKSLKAMCNATMTNGHGYKIKNGKTEVLIDSNSNIQDEYLVKSMINNISPFTTYICWGYVFNEAGNSELSELINVTTLEDVPSAPSLIITNITYSQFIFVWKPPSYLAGNLLEFELVFEAEICFPIPDWCKQIALKTIKHFNGSTFIFEYFNATAFTNYKAKIKARTAAGWGNYNNDLVLFKTPTGVPGIISNFSYLIVNNKNNTNILDTILTWGIPCSLNGILEYFNVSVHGIRTNYTPHFFTFKKYISNNIYKNDAITVNLKELKAEYNYTFKVVAKVQGIQDFGMPAFQHILYPADIPLQPDEDYIKSITIDPTNARRSTTTVTLLLPLFPDTNGDIVYYSIIVSRINYNIASSMRFSITDHTWPNISSWEEAMLQDFTIPYQATKLWWDPYPNSITNYGKVKAVKYTLGEDINCKEISSCANKTIYCNGPLKSNTWYHVRMRAFSRGGYSDSTTFLIKTNAEINIVLVSGVVFGILFLGILLTMILLFRKCSLHTILRRFLYSDMSGSPIPTPFSKKKFIVHCQQLIDNPGKLSNEFQLLQTLSVDLQMPTNTASLQANKKKNRYSDILPYDFSRVKLIVIENDPNTDYINASFIKGYSGEDEYIACQGPKEETTFDFWRMIEQYNINVIVMLTELVEKGKEKCYQYFPTIRETFKYENMTIKCTSELDYRSYTQRTLVLQKENKKRNITHLHFKEWPDHDVPEDFDPMINFCQIVRRNAIANKEYIVIHCSAGIGRTGTLIAIDIILQHLRDNRKLDVFRTVYRLRHHRINMVQKESQYACIYNCIKQVLKNPYCLKNYKLSSMDPVYKNSTNV